jgi:hypothetical protein
VRDQGLREVLAEVGQTQAGTMGRLGGRAVRAYRYSVHVVKCEVDVLTELCQRQGQERGS